MLEDLREPGARQGRKGVGLKRSGWQWQSVICTGVSSGGCWRTPLLLLYLAARGAYPDRRAAGTPGRAATRHVLSGQTRSPDRLRLQPAVQNVCTVGRSGTYFAYGTTKLQQKLDLHVIEQVVRELAPHGLRYVDLEGETFLHPDY